MQDSVTQVQLYRQTLSPSSTTSQLALFDIPSHSGSSLAIETMCFFDPAGSPTVQMGDTLHLLVFQPGSPPTLLAQVFAVAAWIVTGLPVGNTTAFLNPGSDPWMEFAPPIRLAPNDTPVVISLRNDTAARMPSGVQVVVVGWEFWSSDVSRQWPAPQHLAGAKS